MHNDDTKFPDPERSSNTPFSTRIDEMMLLRETTKPIQEVYHGGDVHHLKSSTDMKDDDP